MGGLSCQDRARRAARTTAPRLHYPLRHDHKRRNRSMRMLVLGAGLQGSACAYDLLQNPEVTQVRLADLRVDHLPSFLAPHSGPRLLPTPVDARDHEAVSALMRESDAVMSALPYYFNFEMARLAVEAKAHFTDLGGNKEIVQEQKTLDGRAKSQKVSVVPDTGLAPGMVNILAQ